ncbi:hypothetical protein SD70_29320 [Gordoniibacillus kamchatkensis]|uniref:Uncharacterized protein n=1 Tax=Gordoniibacillus kamchatkensis TaxID=1590651 RepID=A0ABR5AAJ3_9BACL|nr:hypothetical protein [Paenibacillus sp. VKM B-2647]KIL38001.1 hypothetical protein SD70_29320 [Paenibacillus sp. VKM B-2647]
MNRHMGKVNELLGKLDESVNAKKSKLSNLNDRLQGIKARIKSLTDKLNVAASEDGDDAEKLFSEIREAERNRADLEELHRHVNTAGPQYAVKTADLIAAFREATDSIREDVDAAAQKAQEAKRAYEEALNELHQICKEQWADRRQVDNAGRAHFGKALEYDLPKLALPPEPFLSKDHHNEYANRW